MTLDVSLRSKGGEPLAGKDLRARLERPTDARALTGTAPGTYAGRVEDLPGGQWRLAVEVVGPEGVELRRERRLTLD